MLVLLAIPLSSAALLYAIEADRSGASAVTVSIEGGETAMVPLPADASSFRIVGGSYSVQDGSAMLSPGQSGFATFSFTSASLTAKSGPGWRMSFIPPEGASVTVLMPSYAVLEDASPYPDSVSAEDSRTLLRLDGPAAVSIYYHLEDAPRSAQAVPDLPLYLLSGAILVLAAASLHSMLRQPQKARADASAKAATLDMTLGKKEMMETFNENDITIVRYLLSNQGRSRRNELERGCGLSKSSLAMALNRLEKRKIIDIDRGATTHFIKLSDYFLRL